jgi:hypothetical protein
MGPAVPCVMLHNHIITHNVMSSSDSYREGKRNMSPTQGLRLKFERKKIVVHINLGIDGDKLTLRERKRQALLNMYSSTWSRRLCQQKLYGKSSRRRRGRKKQNSKRARYGEEGRTHYRTIL